MATITTQFRNFKEPTKDQLLRNYFSLPPLPTLDTSGSEKDGSLPVDRVEINAVCELCSCLPGFSVFHVVQVLSLADGQEDSYVSSSL